MGSVGVIDRELCHTTIWRRKEMHPDPSHPAAIPAITEKSPNHIVAVNQQTGHVIGLIQHALTIVCKVWCQDIVSNPPTIQEDAIAAEGGHIEPRVFYALRQSEDTTKVCGWRRQ